MAKQVPSDDPTALSNKSLVGLAELYYTAKFSEGFCRAQGNENGIRVNHEAVEVVLEELKRRDAMVLKWRYVPESEEI